MSSNNNLLKNLSAFAIFFAFWFSMFMYTGSIDSGYHLIDDHQIITLSQQLKTAPVHSVAKKLVLYDGRFRFRPLFSIHRVIMTKILGLNFTAWSVYIGLMGVFTSFFLFMFSRITGYSLIQSILFSLLTLTGVQSVIWYQYADAENLCMFFLSLSMLFMAMSVHHGRHKLKYDLLFITSLFASSLCKESFILMIPAMLFLYLCLYSRKNNLSLFKSFKVNIYLTGIPSVILIISLLYIIFFVGINKTGQTGIDNKVFSLMFIREFIYNIRQSTFFLTILFGIFIISDYIISKKQFHFNKDFFKKILTEFLNITVLFLLIIIPQYLLYYKSGMRDRYLLPYFLGFSFFLIYLLKRIFESKNKPVLIKYLFLSMIVVLLFFQIKNDTLPYMKIYADDSRSSGKMMDSVIANTQKETIVTAVIDPVQNFEQGKSFMIYLRNFADKKNINFKLTRREYVTESFSDSSFYKSSERATRVYFKRELFDSVKNKDDIKCVVVFPKLELKFINENTDWFRKDDFRREEFELYTVYYRKE